VNCTISGRVLGSIIYMMRANSKPQIAGGEWHFPVSSYSTTGAALIENNEASAKLTTANGGTFTRAQPDSVANHVTARSIGDSHALT